MVSINAAPESLFDCLGPPLCRASLVGHFDYLRVRLSEGGNAPDHAVHWALGFLANGQSEVLGVWVVPADEEGRWGPILDDLRLRGVERVRFVVGVERTEEAGSSWAVFRGVTLLPSVGRLIRECLSDVAPRNCEFVAAELERIRAASSVGEARALLAAFAAGRRGIRYASVVARWEIALERLGPLYAMASRQRALVTSGDDLVQGLRRKLQLAIARHGVFADDNAAVAFVVRALERAELGLASVAPKARASRAERSGSWSDVQAVNC